MYFLRLTLIVFLLFLSNLRGTAQSWTFLRHEVFAGLAASNFLGELGGANQIGTNGLKDLEFSLTRPTINLGYRFIFSPNLALRTQFCQGWLAGNDAKTTEFFRQNRNLNFRSAVSELTVMFEYYPFRERIDHSYRMKGVKGKRARYLSPYIATGFGGFFFNTKGKYDGKWYKLHSLKTEGQGLPGGAEPYKRISICIPISVGLKYALSKQWSIGFELSGRKTFTDYIDDVSTVYYDPTALATVNPMSPLLANPTLNPVDYDFVTNPGQQRGDPKDKDAYMFAIFSLHYRFLKYRMHLPKY